LAKPVDVRPAAAEELATEAHVETGPANASAMNASQVDDAAARQSDRDGTDVRPVARTGPSLGEVAFEDGLETPLAMALDGAALAWECQAGGKLAKQLEQRQVRPCSRFESMGLGLEDGDGAASDCRPQA
jgi:hypothetical protein